MSVKPFLIIALILYPPPPRPPRGNWSCGIFLGYKMGTLARNGLTPQNGQRPTNCLNVFDHFVGLVGS